jgi:hypothetical protein
MNSIELYALLHVKTSGYGLPFFVEAAMPRLQRELGLVYPDSESGSGWNLTAEGHLLVDRLLSVASGDKVVPEEPSHEPKGPFLVSNAADPRSSCFTYVGVPNREAAVEVATDKAQAVIGVPAYVWACILKVQTVDTPNTLPVVVEDLPS